MIALFTTTISTSRCITRTSAFRSTSLLSSSSTSWTNLSIRKNSITARQQQQTHLFSSASGGGGRVSNAVTDKEILSKSSNDKSKKQQKVKLDTNPPKGTRDFFPEDMRVRNWLFDTWRDVAKTYGFSEYDAPVLESESLYTRKAGEEVTQQLYNFKDKGDRQVALRPEMTPSLARMVMSKKNGLPLPLKWFSIPQCWRYERMTRGRRREHYQWNMDIWGIQGIQAEAELLSAMVTFFKKVGLSSEDVGIKVNSRLVITEILGSLGVPEDKFAATCVLIDKLEKVPLEAIRDDLTELGLTEEIVLQLTTILTSKSIDSIRESLPPDSEAASQLESLMELAASYGISDWIEFDASVIRGLAYYTGIVFEAFDRSGNLRAIAGGGRYDKLLETFGGEATPAAGFGFGDAVIMELLKDKGVLPSFEKSGFDAVVFAMSEDLYGGGALRAASLLREAGKSVDVILEPKKTKWVFKHADRIGVRHVILVGGDEWADNEQVSVKDMEGGSQIKVPIAELSAWAKQSVSES